MFPILMVVSVIPCVLSARAVIDPRVESSRASPSAVKRWFHVFMCTSAEGWPRRYRESSRASTLPQRARQARPDVGPGFVHVGRGGRARGCDLPDPLVDLVLAPVAHGRRDALQDPGRRLLDGQWPATRHRGPALARVESLLRPV